MKLARTEDEVNEQLSLAGEGIDNGTRWPALSFEDGVDQALRWALGWADDRPMSDE